MHSPLAVPSQPEAETFLRAGTVTVDPAHRVVRCKDQTIALTPKEYALLETLVRERNRVLTRGALFERLYTDRADSSDKVIEVLMSTLRGKLARAGASELIETRRGMGYVIPA